jgi:hypothetical protein
MNAQRASFLLLVALAVSPVAIPVRGQTTIVQHKQKLTISVNGC